MKEEAYPQPAKSWRAVELTQMLCTCSMVSVALQSWAVLTLSQAKSLLRTGDIPEWGKNPADTTRSSLPTNSSTTVKKTTDKKSKLQEANVCQAKWLLVRQGQGTDCRTGHTAYQRAAQHWPGTELPQMLLAAAEPEKPTGTLSEAPSSGRGLTA